MSPTTRALLRTSLIVLAAAAALPAVPAEWSPARRAPAAVAASDADGRVIVRFKAGTERMRAQAAGDRIPHHAQALGAALGVALRDGTAIDTRTQAMRATGTSSAALMALLRTHPDVEAVYEDQRRRITAVPSDPFYPGGQVAITPAVGQWYLRNSSPTLVSSINAEAAWDVTLGSPSIVVADLDTGVRFDHPDLAGKLLPGYDFISADSNGSFTTAADGDGRDADPSDPGDFDVNFPQYGSTWHGTQTSGLIAAATNNGVGMASIGRNVMILPVRVLGVDGGLDSDIVAGMRWASGLHVPGVPDNPQANWASVINMSLGGTGACTQLYRDAVVELAARGTVVVAAAGNEEGLAVDAPANCPGVVGVGAVRHSGTKVGFSNVGPELSITAPGGNCVNATGACLYPLLTTTNAGFRTPVAYTGQGTYTDSFDATIGTSFSTPLVSGTLALMFSADPTLTAAQAIDLLKATARPFSVTGGSAGIAACRAPSSAVQDECYCTTSTCGAGMLDAGGAVLAAVGQQARITRDAGNLIVGTPITFRASSSILNARNVVSYTWTLTDTGATPSSLVASADGLSATLTPSSVGSYQIALTIVDSTGARMSAQSAVDIGNPPSDSGGGALGAGWLLLLGLGTAALAVLRVRRA